MREPPARVRFIGHPAVATPLLGLCGLLVYEWTQHPEAILIGVGAIIAALWVMRAQQTASQYRSWQRAWDNMAEPRPARAGATAPRWVAGLIAVLVVGGFTLADQGGVAVSAGGLAALAPIALVGLPLIAILLLVKRRRSEPKTARASATVEPVRVTVRGAVFAVPTLENAYRSLPEHSQRVMLS